MTEQQDLLLERFDQVGILVKDIDEAAQKIEDVLGLSATVKREASDEGYRAAIVPLRVGRLLLLQPTTDDSPLAKQLAERGEGMHHVSFHVDDVEQATSEIKERGGSFVVDVPRQGITGRNTIISPESTGGVPVEIKETTLFTPGTSREIGLHHVTIRTNDVDTASATWEHLFRMPVKRKYISEGFGMSTSWLDAGDAEVEFAQDLNEDGPVARALKLMGEGLHAINLDTDEPEALEERVRAAGVRIIVDDGEPENVLRAVHPLDFLGTLVLISKRDAEQGGPQQTQPAEGGAH